MSVVPAKVKVEKLSTVSVDVPLNRLWVNSDTHSSHCRVDADDPTGELQLRIEDDGETVYVSDGSHEGVVEVPFGEFRAKVLAVLMSERYGAYNMSEQATNIASPSRFPCDVVVFVPKDVSEWGIDDVVWIDGRQGKVVGKDGQMVQVELDEAVMPADYPTTFSIKREEC